MAEGLTVGQIARAADVSTATIRYYEKLGLLPAPTRTPSGYRSYTTAIVRRLLVIRSAQAFGFSLREIAGFLRVRDRGGRPCESVREAAQTMVAAIDQQIADLVARRQQMVDVLATWDERLGRTRSDERAYLLDMLREGNGTVPIGRPGDRRPPRRQRHRHRVV